MTHCNHCHKTCEQTRQNWLKVNKTPPDHFGHGAEWDDGWCLGCKIATAIKEAADETWAEIEKYIEYYCGTIEPGSVDPELAERHAGLIIAWKIAQGFKHD